MSHVYRSEALVIPGGSSKTVPLNFLRTSGPRGGRLEIIRIIIKGVITATSDGSTSITGDMPINPSGGVLSSNPIGASGMRRFAEAALQVRGMAGEHQVDGARRAMGHAYGGGAQFFAMWIVGSQPL